MKAKEKAEELVNKIYFIHGEREIARLCAIIVVDEILKTNPTSFLDPRKSTKKYWEDVMSYLKEPKYKD